MTFHLLVSVLRPGIWILTFEIEGHMTFYLSVSISGPGLFAGILIPYSEDGKTYVFPSEITGRERKSYDILSWQNLNYGHSNSETRHDEKNGSLQDMFEIYGQLAPGAQSRKGIPLPQLDKTLEWAPAKSQTVWTLEDNYLDFDVLTEFGLTYQNRHYTITETYKAL